VSNHSKGNAPEHISRLQWYEGPLAQPREPTRPP